MASSNNQMYSVFIPTISKIDTEEIIVDYFALNCVGKVERVDFVEFQNDGEDRACDAKRFQQAFVHFSPQQKTREIMEAIEQKGSYRFYPFKQQNQYWILLKNKNPVPKTELNVNQLAHNQKLMEEREALMVEKMEKMEQRMAQMEERSARMEEREARMVQRMTKMEDEMKMIILLNEKFAQTFDVQTANLQTLSNLVCKRNQPETQATPDMTELEQKISDLKSEVDDQYWRLISKNESLAADVSTIYERLWLDVEKLIKKTDKNTTDIADHYDRLYKLTHKVRFADDKINRVIDTVQSVIEEQVSDKEVSDLKTDIMRYGEPRRGKMIIEELL
jgi:Txe/YoeB family toxin of Txe-Axe toxin-antitoxin module